MLFQWGDLLGDLEQSQQADAAEDRDAERGNDVSSDQDDLEDAHAHHEAVEAVEQGHEVGLQAQTVHLHQHLTCEQSQQNLVGHIWRAADIII